MCSIIIGERPTRPGDSMKIGLSDPLWELLKRCWDGDRTRRPQMQDVEVQIGNAAVQWEGVHTPRRRPPPPSSRPGGLLPTPLMASFNSSSTGTRNSTASDQSRLSIPDIRIVGPDENEQPHHMQEFYPPPSPISPSYPGGPSTEAKINRLDGVSPRVAQSDLVLMAGLGSGTGFRR